MVRAGDAAIAPALLRITPTGSLYVYGRLMLGAKLICDGTIDAYEITVTNDIDTIHCNGLLTAGKVRLMNSTCYNTGSILAADSLILGWWHDLYNTGRVKAGAGLVPNIFFNQGRAEFTHGLWALTFINSDTLVGGGEFVFHAAMTNTTGAHLGTDTLTLLTPDAQVEGSVVVHHRLEIGYNMQPAGLELLDGATVQVWGDLHNLGMIEGEGSICVLGDAQNHGTITGQVDICDATPTMTNAPFLDLNTGTVAASVTFCAAGPCGTTGLGEASVLQDAVIIPDPGSGYCTVRIPGNTLVAGYILLDAQGRRLGQGAGRFHGDLRVPVPQVAGLYLLLLRDASGHAAVHRVLFH